MDGDARAELEVLARSFLEVCEQILEEARRAWAVTSARPAASEAGMGPNGPRPGGHVGANFGGVSAAVFDEITQLFAARDALITR